MCWSTLSSCDARMLDHNFMIMTKDHHTNHTLSITKYCHTLLNDCYFRCHSFTLVSHTSKIWWSLHSTSLCLLPLKSLDYFNSNRSLLLLKKQLFLGMPDINWWRCQKIPPWMGRMNSIGYKNTATGSSRCAWNVHQPLF